jgi:hypothetical protein
MFSPDDAAVAHSEVFDEMAYKYANFITLAINENDADAYRNCLEYLIRSGNDAADGGISDAFEASKSPIDVKNGGRDSPFICCINVYNSLKNFSQGNRKPLNLFGKSSSATFCSPISPTYQLGSSDLYEYQINFLEIVPDGFMKLLSSRCCYNSSTSSVFISAFQYKGTITSTDSILLLPKSAGETAQGDSFAEKGSTLKTDSVEISSLAFPKSAPSSCKVRKIPVEKIVTSSKKDVRRPFSMEGSLVLYRNNITRGIYKIEWFYEVEEVK